MYIYSRQIFADVYSIHQTNLRAYISFRPMRLCHSVWDDLQASGYLQIHLHHYLSHNSCKNLLLILQKRLLNKWPMLEEPKRSPTFWASYVDWWYIWSDFFGLEPYAILSAYANLNAHCSSSCIQILGAASPIQSQICPAAYRVYEHVAD